LDKQREEWVFVLGSPGARDFLERLWSFVLECERLRVLARSGRTAGQPARGGGGKRPAGFTPEHDIDGTGSGRPADPITIRRLHGRIVNALQKKLGSKAINETRFDMRPDLYIRSRDGLIETLFEVKASSDTQSWFTALGQLVVYAAPQKPPPKRVLVCPAPRNDPSFTEALTLLGVEVVTFKLEDNGTISFAGLEDALTRTRRLRPT
jgi:hypothetical protein